MSSADGSNAAPKTWIPIDVKIHWFSFLDARDLAVASRVCKPWSSLVQKAAEAMIATTTGAACPPLTRSGKLRLLSRLQNATAKENMGHLLAWAAGSRDLSPFLHKLLLLRDTIREDCGLPGGLHEPARPDAYAETDDEVRALFTYRTGGGPVPGAAPGAPEAPGVDLIPTPPLIVAAQRGNVDAIHLLLLFGEGAGPRHPRNDRALYTAVEQGNALCVAALLGRTPLRPPLHPPHIAKRLGLVRPTWNVYGAGYTYCAGADAGPRSVAAAIAGAKSRAEVAAASGASAGSGAAPRASAAAAASVQAAARARAAGGGTAVVSPAEALVSQTEAFEADGRVRTWCRGYRMGTFWHTYDTTLANWEALYGIIGGAADLHRDRIGDAPAVEEDTPNDAPRLPPKKKESRAAVIALARATTLLNLSARLDAHVLPGTTLGPPARGVMAAYAAQALVVSRLHPSLPLPSAVRVRSRGFVNPHIPAPIDYGAIAAVVTAERVRLNIGPVDGRTPLNVAVERGRFEITWMLLTHNDPEAAERGEIPQIISKTESAGGGDGGMGAVAPGGAPAAAPVAAPPAGAPGGAPDAAALGGAAVAGLQPSPLPASVMRARLALSNISSASASALAIIPSDVDPTLGGPKDAPRRREFIQCVV